MTQGDTVAAPMRIGILDDMADGPPGFTDNERWIRLAVDDLLANGRLDRDVEFVNSYGLGLPSGTAAAVEHAYEELVAQDPLLIVGPAIGDNAIVATPFAERHRVPTINWAGSERGRGEWMFHLQVGSHEDESIVLARHVQSIGAHGVAVVSDRSPIGRRHLDFFVAEAEVLGLAVVGSATVSPIAEDATGEVDRVLAAGPDAVVYLGLGLSAPAVAKALTARGFDGPRALNTAGLRGYAPDYGKVIDQWVYLDMFSDDNTELARAVERVGPPAVAGMRVATGWDVGRLVAEGLARAPERSRAGVKEGLERIKWLPAAEGHEGTLLGFGLHDRGGLHGRYLVLRQWRDGVSVQI